jgi:hypothetical protein
MAKSTKNSIVGGSEKRTTIAPNNDKRYIKRNENGQIKESDDQGRSLSKDVKQTAKTKVKPGYGDLGDQAKSKPPKNMD